MWKFQFELLRFETFEIFSRSQDDLRNVQTQQQELYIPPSEFKREISDAMEADRFPSLLDTEDVPEAVIYSI